MFTRLKNELKKRLKPISLRIPKIQNSFTNCFWHFGEENTKIQACAHAHTHVHTHTHTQSLL